MLDNVVAQAADHLDVKPAFQKAGFFKKNPLSAKNA